jgi:hypothetical protein
MKLLLIPILVTIFLILPIHFKESKNFKNIWLLLLTIAFILISFLLIYFNYIKLKFIIIPICISIIYVNVRAFDRISFFLQNRGFRIPQRASFDIVTLKTTKRVKGTLTDYLLYLFCILFNFFILVPVMITFLSPNSNIK